MSRKKPIRTASFRAAYEHAVPLKGKPGEASSDAWTDRDGIDWCRCPECGSVQGDMGHHVRCEECGYGPMPTRPTPPAKEKPR